ncbi:alpha-galactosidase [Christensenellaceae bacterium OttesenSCG-928-K19]|nr:alpha-galactosidase [Christensenellaceae bacterium OttesenSCG-928-K19]
MEKEYHFFTSNSKGVCLRDSTGTIFFSNFFGLPGISDGDVLETTGMFFLDADTGRYEGGKWAAVCERKNDNSLLLTQRTRDGVFEVRSEFVMEERTGVLSRQDTLVNLDSAEHTVFACLARTALHMDDAEVYGQFSGWCMEDEGGWTALPAGELTLSNTMGRSTENANPFLGIRQKSTGYGVCVHVLPVGDWILRLKKTAGHKTSYFTLEAGLSDNGLRMTVAGGEALPLPETLYYGFDTSIENAMERFHIYLHNRYPNGKQTDAVYNSWFYGFDEIDRNALEKQVLAAKKLGCRYFVVDAGWFGDGVDWDNQVGNWQESKNNAFYGDMKSFAAYVRSHKLEFGLWMDPERAAKGSRVYQEHPDWFMHGDAMIYDVTKPEVAKYLYQEISRLVEEYELSWMKVDCNINMQRDLTGSNFYRYYRVWNDIMGRVIKDHPQCVFEGCASGGLRTDIENVLDRFAGHFISDSVHPLETLHMRQSAALRILPQYLGSWMVAQQVSLPVASYFNHETHKRKKLLACADAWWERVVDLSADFCMKTLIMGNAGFSGNIASFDEDTVQTIQKWLAFYHRKQDFFAKATCRNLTEAKGIHSIGGWVVMQYTAAKRDRMLLFAFRLQSNVPHFICYPAHIAKNQTYNVLIDDVPMGEKTGQELAALGITLECKDWYSARIVELAATK